MDPPTDDTELKPEALEVEKEGGAAFQCDLYDADLVHKIAQEFLPGLASACVDNTTGGLFRSPGSVAVDIRREMVDYLVQRSENFVAESVVVDGTPNEEISENPKDIISDMVDDFASSKRNFFSRVSGWLLSERREDRIDDFVQEMEVNGFWLLNRREAVAQTLLKNVDFKNMYHCNVSFKSPEELDEHKLNCGFRTMLCTNEGCDARFSVVHTEKHDSMCPFKILKCEQSCEAMLMRREMDRHCITVCPMKLVKCPFHSIGCQASIPQRTTDQHKSEDVSSHLVYVLQVVHKEASEEDLKARAEELIKMSTPGKLATARDARALTYSIKDLEAKLGPLKVTAKKSDETNDSADKKEEDNPDKVNDSTDKKDDKTTKHVTFADLPNEKKESVNSPSKGDDSQDHSQEQKNLAESQPDKNNAVQEKPKESRVQSESQPNNNDVVQERSIESPVGGEDGLPKANKPEVQVGEPVKNEPNEAEGDQISKSSEEKASEPIKNEPNEAEGEQRSKSLEEKVSEPIKNKPNEVEGEQISKSSEEKASEPIKNEPSEAEGQINKSLEEKVGEPVKSEPLKAEVLINKHSEEKVGEPVQGERSKAEVPINKSSEEKVGEPVKSEPIKAEVPINKYSEEKVGEPVKGEPSKAEVSINKSSEEKVGEAVKSEPSKAEVPISKSSEEKAGEPIENEHTTPPIETEKQTQ